jgi:signal peptide peptidase SppA
MEVFSDDKPWAITPGAIRALLATARHTDFEALAARLGQPVDNGGPDVQNHNGTAVLDIRGPLFRYRSIWTWLLGGTAIEDASLDLHAALDDPAVKSIVLAINSPGGQIDGINEFANMVRAANAVKPVTAYVDGMAASGAYWLASAAGRIVADETAQLGSIGVLATVVDDSAVDERRGVKRFDVISSQSPLKRTDPATDEGREQLQTMVDQMAQVFIEHVAAFRGTSAERVASAYGRGAVLSARAAISVGMADALGSLEGLIGRGDQTAPIRDIRDVPGLRVESPKSNKVKLAAPFDEGELEEDDTDLTNNPGCNCPEGDCSCDDESDESQGTEQEPDDSSVPESEGDLMTPTEDRQRIAAILTCEEARGRDDLARMLALETNHSVDAAKKLLLAAPAAPAKPANALEARMSQIPNPVVGVAEKPDQDSPAAEIAKILAFVPQARKRPHVQ